MGGDEPSKEEAAKTVILVFPAWAGMNRKPLCEGPQSAGVPRVGGDEPGTVADYLGLPIVFPAWAGMNRIPHDDEHGHRKVFPAWAGMNRRRGKDQPTGKGVPRVGGDEPKCGRSLNGFETCSPRGRG